MEWWRGTHIIANTRMPVRGGFPEEAGTPRRPCRAEGAQYLASRRRRSGLGRWTHAVDHRKDDHDDSKHGRDYQPPKTGEGKDSHDDHPVPRASRSRSDASRQSDQPERADDGQRTHVLDLRLADKLRDDEADLDQSTFAYSVSRTAALPLRLSLDALRAASGVTGGPAPIADATTHLQKAPMIARRSQSKCKHAVSDEPSLRTMHRAA
jgi:hypothetical protein